MIALEKRSTLELFWKKPTFEETSNESFSKELHEFSKFLGHCKFEMKPLFSASKKGLKNTPTRTVSQQKNQSEVHEIDPAKQNSQSDEITNKVFIVKQLKIDIEIQF